MSIIRDELNADQGGVLHPAPDLDRRGGRRLRGRRPDRPRGHGGHRHPRRLHQARAALGLPGAAPRRQGPLGHGDPRRGFRLPPVRRQHPHAGAVLLLARPGLQDEGLAPAGGRAAGRAARRWSTCCRSTTGERITSIMPLPRGRGGAGRQLDVMFATRPAAIRRNKLSDFVPRSTRTARSRHEARRGRRASSASNSASERDDVLLTTARRPVRSASRSPTSASSAATARPARRPACAASRSPRATRVISMSILRHVDATPAERDGLPQAIERHSSGCHRRGSRSRGRCRGWPRRPRSRAAM